MRHYHGIGRWRVGRGGCWLLPAAGCLPPHLPSPLPSRLRVDSDCTSQRLLLLPTPSPPSSPNSRLQIPAPASRSPLTNLHPLRFSPLSPTPRALARAATQQSRHVRRSPPPPHHSRPLDAPLPTMTTLRSFQAEIANFSHEKQIQSIQAARDAHAAAEQAKHHKPKPAPQPQQQAPTSPIATGQVLVESEVVEEPEVPIAVSRWGRYRS